ncbi:hypothetical protein K2X33_13165, partial [bacterium]|nr:hypothetical protein [bacterium]
MWQLSDAQEGLLGIEGNARNQPWWVHRRETSRRTFFLTHTQQPPHRRNVPVGQLSDALSQQLNLLYEGFAEEGGRWTLILEGQQHSAIVSRWHLVADLIKENGRFRAKVRGLQAEFFIPGVSEVRMFRTLKKEEMQAKILRLENALEYSETAVNSSALPEYEMALPVMPWEALWSTQVIVLIGKSETRTHSGVLWQKVDEPNRYRMSYQGATGIQEVQLSEAALGEVGAFLRLQRSLRGLRLRSASAVPQLVNIESLVIDMRGSETNPVFHLIVHNPRHSNHPYQVVRPEDVILQPERHGAQLLIPE